MAGPCTEVLLRRPLCDAERARLTAYIRTIASSVESRAFWVAGQPFIWTDEGETDDLPTAGALGWNPGGSVMFCAMCRGPVSEAYLAMLAGKVATMFDGIVALGYHIKQFADDGILLMAGRYESEDEDLVTPDFLHHWIGHPAFRMAN